jgi:hypothetical protein
VRSQHHDWVSPPALDPEEAADRLLRDLRSDRDGLSGGEAERRLLQYGPNALQRRAGPQWPKALVRQLTHSIVFGDASELEGHHRPHAMADWCPVT